jgi:hypothetical protein
MGVKVRSRLAHPMVVIPESAQRLSGTQERLHRAGPVSWVPDSLYEASGMTTV